MRVVMTYEYLITYYTGCTGVYDNISITRHIIIILKQRREVVIIACARAR